MNDDERGSYGSYEADPDAALTRDVVQLLFYLFEENSKGHVTPLTCSTVNRINHILNSKHSRT